MATKAERQRFLGDMELNNGTRAIIERMGEWNVTEKLTDREHSIAIFTVKQAMLSLALVQAICTDGLACRMCRDNVTRVRAWVPLYARRDGPTGREIGHSESGVVRPRSRASFNLKRTSARS